MLLEHQDVNTHKYLKSQVEHCIGYTEIECHQHLVKMKTTL